MGHIHIKMNSKQVGFYFAYAEMYVGQKKKKQHFEARAQENKQFCMLMFALGNKAYSCKFLNC